MSAQDLIRVANLAKTYPVRTGWSQKLAVEAVKNVSLSLRAGETLALIGESGSGKTTLGRMILGLLEPSAGEVKYKGEPLRELRGPRRRAYHKTVQAVFQDPYLSLNPRMRVGEIISEPLRNFGYPGDRRRRLADLLEVVGLSRDFAWRYPYQCSGGQKQRVAIARALAAEPEAIIMDEPLSFLDITIQTQLITLLNDLKARQGLGYLLISHDLRVVRTMADRVAVMFLGEVVETASKDEFFRNPRHPHSQALLAAVPALVQT